MSEPVPINDPKLSFVEKHILGEKYIDFNKEPLVKVADAVNAEYVKTMERIGVGEQVIDKKFFVELAEKRRELCEARLQASKSSKVKRLRDEGLKWEAELWYTEVALDQQRSDQVIDKRVLKSVARSISGEIIDKNRDNYLKNRFSPFIGSIGEAKFEKRTLELAKLFD